MSVVDEAVTPSSADDVPNFVAAQASAEALADALGADGVLRLRGAVDRNLTTELRHLHAQASEAVERMDFNGADAYTMRRRLARHEFLLSELDPKLPQATIAALHPVIGRAAAVYLATAPSAHPIISIRRVDPSRAGSGLVFHQDAGILNIVCLNVWFPLHDVDETMPSLEVVKGSHGAILKRPKPGEPATTDALEIAEDDVVAQWGRGAIVAPRMAEGDALLFDGACVHRSELGRSRPRASVEVRLIAKPAQNA